VDAHGPRIKGNCSRLPPKVLNPHCFCNLSFVPPQRRLRPPEPHGFSRGAKNDSQKQINGDIAGLRVSCVLIALPPEYAYRGAAPNLSIPFLLTIVFGVEASFVAGCYELTIQGAFQTCEGADEPDAEDAFLAAVGNYDEAWQTRLLLGVPPEKSIRG